MSEQQFHFTKPVILVGGGKASTTVIDACRQYAPHIIAADGGADWLDQNGYPIDGVIGDFDSLTSPDIWKQRLGTNAVEMPDQNSSDFDKCLSLIKAPVVLAIGFLGERFDHALYALQAMCLSDQQVIMLDNDNCLCALNDQLTAFAFEPGNRVSIMPVRETYCEKSRGLEWPVAGHTLAPDGLRSLSNMVVESPLQLKMHRKGAVLMAGYEHLDVLYQSAVSRL